MIYQIAYDGSTKDNCVYPCIMNDKVSPYFESKIIHDFVKKHGTGDDYFGILSHKFFNKNIRVTQDKIQKAIDDDIDCISFFSKYKSHDLLKCADNWHPGFSKLFHELCKASGLPVYNGKTWKIIIYQNAFICRSEIYKDYVDNWLSPFIEVMESDAFKERLWIDSGYHRKNESDIKATLIRDLGVDYYPLHSFVCERLPNLYFQHHKYSLSAI